MATVSKNRENSVERKHTQKYISNIRERERFTPTKENEYSFLNYQFQDIHTVNLPDKSEPFGQVHENGQIMWDLGYGYKIMAEENIETLADAVEAYCRANGADYKYNKSANPTQNLMQLWTIARNAAPEKCELNLDYCEKNNQIVIVEYALCDFDYYTVFFLPVNFINRLPKGLKPVVTDAFRYVTWICGLNSPSEHMDMAVALGEWGSEYLEDVFGSEDAKEYMQYVEEYLTGDIGELINQATALPTKEKNIIRNELKNALNEQAYSEYFPLLQTLINGIDLHDGDHLQNYYINPQQCTIEEYDNSEAIIDMARLFAVVYDFMDPIAERAIDALNGECGSMEVEGLYDRRMLTKDIKYKFEPSEFPKKWCEWFQELVERIQKI